MSQVSDDKNKKTLQIIKTFLHDEVVVINKIKEKYKIIQDATDYMKIINEPLFSWAISTDLSLKQCNNGSIDIKIDEHQPDLSINKEGFFDRDLSVLRGCITIKINMKKPFTMKAEILFTRQYGKFLWDTGDEEGFFSKCHLAQNHENWDSVDMLSAYGPREPTIKINGQCCIFKHPVDLINERLFHRMSKHIIVGYAVDSA